MPKKGTIKCQDCDRQFNGTLPDNKTIGYRYESRHREIDQGLVVQLKDHYYYTGKIVGYSGNAQHIERQNGHRYFDVFLEDGSIGEIEANSYHASYKELGRGKER